MAESTERELTTKEELISHFRDEHEEAFLPFIINKISDILDEKHHDHGYDEQGDHVHTASISFGPVQLDIEWFGNDKDVVGLTYFPTSGAVPILDLITLVSDFEEALKALKH